jgi:hypothetical protein
MEKDRVPSAERSHEERREAFLQSSIEALARLDAFEKDDSQEANDARAAMNDYYAGIRALHAKEKSAPSTSRSRRRMRRRHLGIFFQLAARDEAKAALSYIFTQN